MTNQPGKRTTLMRLSALLLSFLLGALPFSAHALRKYEDAVLDTSGNAIQGATVAVTAYPSGSAVTIYSDDGSTAVANSTVTTGRDGTFSFYAAPGRYNFTVTARGTIVDQITDVQIDEGTSSTGQALAASGTAAAPSYSFSLDADTGLFLAGTNAIGFSAGGSEVGRFDAQGFGVHCAADSWQVHICSPTPGQTSVTVDAYGQEAVYLTRTALGTFAAPTALTANTMMANFAARGYHSGGAFTTLSRAGIQFFAAENWTSTAQGTFINFYVTTNGASSSTSKMTLHNNGALILGLTGSAPLTDSGSGAKLQVTGLTEMIGQALITESDLPYLQFKRNGTTKGYVAIGNGSSLLTGSAAGDTLIRAEGNFRVSAGGDATKLALDTTSTAGQTALLLWDVDNGTLERVTVGAADSCGAGFKCLRIAN